MPKQAISVTLGAENVTWLKGRVRGAGVRSVSELLDRIVSAARASGAIGESRSVFATIDIDASDPLLQRADPAVRAMVETSLGRPLAVREAPPAYRAKRSGRKRRG